MKRPSSPSRCAPLVRHRRVAAAVALTLPLILSGCGGHRSDVTGGPVEPGAPAGGGSGTSAGPAVPLGPAPSSDLPPDTSGAQLTVEQLTGVTDAYLRFVAMADRAAVGDPDAARALAGAADQGVVDLVDNQRRNNEQLKADDVGTQARTSTSNMATITGTPDAVVIADCLSTESDRDVLYLRSLQFVDQITTLRLDGDAWTVARVEIRNDGTLGSGQTTGCATLADRQRITTSITGLMTALDELWADPAQAAPAAVADHVDPTVVDELTAGQAEAVAAGTYLASPAQHRVSVLGTDLVASGRAYVVGVCTLYPEGLTPLSKATGQAAGPALAAPGTAVYREFGVHSTPGEGGVLVDKVFEGRRADTASDCWTRS